jgi:hypothetical protein
VYTEADEEENVFISDMPAIDMAISKNMTVLDVKKKWAKKMNVPVEHLVVVLKGNAELKDFMNDNEKVDMIDCAKFYTMIYEVKPPT